jgi:adenylate cyclase
VSADSEPSKFPQRFSIGFAIFFLILYWPGFIGRPNSPGVFQHLEDVWQDRLFVSHANQLRPADPRILLIALDDDTGKKYGFPLPRARYGDLLDRLKEYGVKTAMFDVMFMEPQSPAADARLIAATKNFGRAIHQYTTQEKFVPGGRNLIIGLPIPGLQDAAQYLGYPNVERVLDADGHVRRSIFFDKRYRDPKGSGIAASFDAVGLASFLDEPVAQIREQFGNPPDRKYYLRYRVPHKWSGHPIRAKTGTMNVEDLYQVHSPYQTISAMDLISGELTADQKKSLKGSIVIIGSTSLGYYDHFPSPFNPESPGSEIHCTTIDNALNGDFMQPMGRGWTALVLILMIVLPLPLLGLAPTIGAGVTVAVFTLWYAFVSWQFERGIRVDLIAPSVALLSSFLAQTVHRVFAEARKAKQTKELWSRFVSKEVVEDLVKNPDKAQLGGEKREMTILFLDIAHFTNISEKMSPDQLIVFLNKYLTGLSSVVVKHNAVVGNYIGDCIMAFWNPPVIPLPEHRAEACVAAIECQAMIAKLNAGLDHAMPEMPAIRVGLNSGTVTVGMTGSEGKLQYTTLGDEVNLASRLEGANKFFGSKIMASEACYAGAREAVDARELGRVRVVGKETPIRVFELIAKKGELTAEWSKALPLYESGLQHFNKREYSQAVVDFTEVVKIFPKDGPANLYLNASKDYSAIPPQDDWDGVFNLTAK